MPTIVALVKHVPDTWSTKSLEDDHTLDRTSVDNIIDEINEYSVEQALRLRDENPDENYRVVAVTMGPAQADEALRKALAMGADDAVLVSDDALAGADALSTAWTLNAAINTLEDVHQVQLSGSTVKGSREDARGTWELEAALPAIISVTDKADKPRFPNFKGLMAAKKAEITTLNVADLGIEAIAPTTTVTESSKRPPRTAGEVISEPQPQDAAKKIADFLAAKNLI